MTGSRGEIPQQLLEPCNTPPTPQVPKIYKINAVHHQIVADFATPAAEVYELPPNVSHADIGRQMLDRLELKNWLILSGQVCQAHLVGPTSSPNQRKWNCATGCCYPKVRVYAW